MPERTPTAPPAAPDATDLSGKSFGDFQILRRLGQGGMGQVFLADQLSLKRKVALKFLKTDLASNPVYLRRFRAEAEAVAKVTHANIVQVYSIGETDGMQYMALEYVEGRNLRDYLTRKGPPELPIVVSIMKQVAAALQRAGESGIIHRDIKPENILLTRKGEVKVADFGLSRSFGDTEAVNLTQSGQTMGTPLYMSPEQVRGQALDPRSDIYSFGITCYHMLAGHPPFRGGGAMEVALKHCEDEAQPLAELRPDLPPELIGLVHRMISKDPAKRPQTGREVLRELASQSRSVAAPGDNPFADMSMAGQPNSKRLMAPPATPTPPASATLRLIPSQPQRRGLNALVVALSLAAALAGGWGLRYLRNSVAAPPATPEDAHPQLQVVNETEKNLLGGVKLFASPKPDAVRQALGLHVQLGVLYLEQKRYADAEKFFDDLSKRTTPPPYKILGQIGLAIVAGLKDETEKSIKAFAELKPTMRGVFQSMPPEDSINLRHWVLEALDRDATRGPLPKAVEELRESIKNPPKRPEGGKAKGPPP